MALSKIQIDHIKARLKEILNKKQEQIKLDNPPKYLDVKDYITKEYTKPITLDLVFKYNENRYSTTTEILNMFGLSIEKYKKGNVNDTCVEKAALLHKEYEAVIDKIMLSDAADVSEAIKQFNDLSI